jgi:hypothetical protein
LRILQNDTPADTSEQNILVRARKAESGVHVVRETVRIDDLTISIAGNIISVLAICTVSSVEAQAVRVIALDANT